MPLAQKQPFISTGEFVVRRNFTFDGVDYKTDEEFPHRDVGCESRKLRNMFDAGYLKAKTMETDEESEDDPVIGKVEKREPLSEARKRRQLNRKLAKAKRK